MLLALSACLYIDDRFHAARVAEVRGQGTATPTPTPTIPDPPAPPAIAGVDPPYGTDAGGTRVVISGGPFSADDPELEVRFGDAVARVIQVEPGAVTVETLPSDVTGLVDVTVVTAGGEDLEPAAFTFWPDAAGKTGATGELVWFTRVGPLWGPKDDDYGRSTLRFVEPVADYQFYKNWAPELDTCTRVHRGVPEYVYEPDITSIDVLEGTAIASSPSAEIEMAWNAAELRFTDYDLDPSQVAPGETYDLRLEGTIGVPEVTLTGALPVPTPFEILDPPFTDTQTPDVVAGQHFEWTTESEGDAFILQVGLINADGTAFEEELYCVSRDVGSFTVPVEMWTSWVPGRQVHVLAGRYNTGSGVLPWNRGRIDVASQLWIYAIGRSQ